MADPLLPKPEALEPNDPAQFLMQRRMAVQATANAALDEDSDGAAQAQDLAHATGDDPSLIYSDLENYQRQHKAILTSEILKQNQAIRDYVEAHPLNATISNDDWGQLDAVSQAIKNFGKDTVIGHTVDMYKALKQGFVDKFGDEPLGQQPGEKEIFNRWRTDFPNLWHHIGRLVVGSEVAGELMTRSWSGAMGAAWNGVVEAQRQMGVDEQTAQHRANTLIGMYEAHLMKMEGAPELAPMMHAQIHDIARYVEPWTEAGKQPLPGHPAVDPLIAEDSKLQMKNLDNIVKETQKSSTFEKAPGFPDNPVGYRSFLAQHSEIHGRMLGISPEGIDLVYPEGKLPEPGDGLLGDVPDIARKVEDARQRGADVEVPLADITMADPDAYKELRDHIRSWPGGKTAEEMKAPEPEPAMAQAPVFTPADSVRRSAGLGPPEEPRGEYLRIGAEGPGETKILIPTSRWTDAEANVQQIVEDYLKKIAPQTETYFASGARRVTIGGKDVQGAYVPARNTPAILYALHDPKGNFRLPDDILSTVRHETMHYLWLNGFLTPAEKEVLKQAALREDWHGRHDIDRRYTGASEQLKLEEAIADEFGRWYQKPEATGAARAVFEKIKEFLLGLREQIIKAMGFDPKVNDLFHRIESGEIGARRLGRAAEGVPRAQEEPIEPGAIGESKKYQGKLLELIGKEAERNIEYQQKIAEREERKRQTKEWKENEGAVREEVTERLRNRPDIAADRFLREGRLYGGKTERIRLNEADLTDEQKASLSPEHYGRGGISPDDAAGLFGYRSGDAMVNALRDLHAERTNEDLTPSAHFNKLRDVETERQMKAKYGKLDENILAEAKEQALNPTTMDRLLEEMVAHGMKHGLKAEEGPITKADLKAWAKEKFNSTPIRELDSDKHFAEIGRTSQKIQRALLDKKPTDAYKLMQQRQMTAELAKLAITYEKERASWDKLEKKLTKREIPNGSEEFTNWIHKQLIKGGYTTADQRIGGDYIRRTTADLAERTARYKLDNFTAFAKERSEIYGLPMDFADHVFDDNWRRPQESMTYEEWKGWTDAIRTLDSYGRSAGSIRKLGKDIDWGQDLKPRMIEQLAKETIGTPKPYKPTPGLLGKLFGDAARIQYKLILLDSVWQRADHGNPYGLFQTTFGYDVARHVGALGIWLRDFQKDLEKLSEFDTNLRKQVENSLFVHPRTREPIVMDKENVRKAITYLGTKSGENKLIRGWMLPEKFSQQQYDMARQSLYDWLGKVSDKKDWDFAQGLWNVNEKIYAKYEEMMFEVGAVPAQRETLNPITIHGKNYDGGYVKLQHDPDVEGTSKKLMGSFDPEDAMGDSGFFRASTPRSHEKQRTGYAGPLYLRLDRDNAAMTNVLRDAAIRPFIINAAKAFYDNEFRDAVQKFGGNAVKEMLDPYLKSVAGMGPRMNRGDMAMDRLINYFSKNTTARLIGWNIHTILKHGLSALINSIGEVGARAIVREWRALDTVGDLDSKLSNEDFAMTTSRELPNRLRMAAGTMAGEWEKLQGKSNWRDWLAEKGAAPIGFFDLKSAIPTWTAAYKQSMIDQIRETGDFNKDLGVSIADRAVSRAHGSTLQSRRPEAMQGGAMARTFTRLYLFFNTMWQRNYEAFWRTKAMAKEFREGEYQRGLEDGRIAIKMLVMGNLAPALIEELITPYPSSDKDSWGKWSAKMLAMGMSGMIPGVREAVHAWVGGYPSTLGILDTGMKDAATLVQDLKAGARAFDNQHGGKTLKAFNSVIGTFTGYTNDEIGRIVKWGWDVTHPNKETPRSLYEHGRSILTGHPREIKK